MKDSKLVIVGTPETILIEIKKYFNMGVTYFALCFPDLPDTRSLQLFAEQIIHHFKTSTSWLPERYRKPEDI